MSKTPDLKSITFSMISSCSSISITSSWMSLGMVLPMRNSLFLLMSMSAKKPSNIPMMIDPRESHIPFPVMCVIRMLIPATITHKSATPSS